MQKQLLKLISIGMRPGDDKDKTEKIKLVNGISLVGVPISFFYSALFAISGYYLHAFTFLIGVIVFSVTVPFNRYFGLNFARCYISVAAPLCFGLVNLISGKDSGFYMGFIVTTIPTILVFDKIRQSLLFIIISLSILALSIAGYQFVAPITDQRFAMIISLVNLFMVLMASLGVVFIFKRELNATRLKIEEKQEEILDSIHYAKRIQNTLITNKEFIEKNIRQNFILFQPKDIVSGDFYWATKKGDRFYLAVCDSTGHGVPGAFMSLLNITFLNEAINEKEILEVNEVFNYVRKKLIASLGNEGQKDGFDGILLCVDSSNGEYTYAAANNAPVQISNGQIIKLPCDKMPVGQGEKRNDFVRYKIDLKPNDSLYLYTDGFADQFGGKNGKKFMYKRLNELLVNIHHNTLDIQKNELGLAFENWKGALEQVDDVLIIGVRV